MPSCESCSDERRAGNLHAAICGGGRRVTTPSTRRPFIDAPPKRSMSWGIFSAAWSWGGGWEGEAWNSSDKIAVVPRIHERFFSMMPFAKTSVLIS